MSITEAINLIEQFGASNNIPVAFSHFTQNVTPPYLVYITPGTDNFNADNIVYAKITELEIELYSRVNVLQTESLLESFLTSNGFCWDKTSQTWIDEDKVTMSIYTVGNMLNV